MLVEIGINTTVKLKTNDPVALYLKIKRKRATVSITHCKKPSVSELF
jgi:hypothetical protein